MGETIGVWYLAPWKTSPTAPCKDFVRITGPLKNDEKIVFLVLQETFVEMPLTYKCLAKRNTFMIYYEIKIISRISFNCPLDINEGSCRS